jgi:hypothetical protein
MYRLKPVLAALLVSACVSSGVAAQNSAANPPGPCADNTTCADTANCKETGATASQCPVYSCLKNQWTRYGVCTQKRATPTAPSVTSDCPRNCREKP